MNTIGCETIKDNFLYEIFNYIQNISLITEILETELLKKNIIKNKIYPLIEALKTSNNNIKLLTETLDSVNTIATNNDKVKNIEINSILKNYKEAGDK